MSRDTTTPPKPVKRGRGRPKNHELTPLPHDELDRLLVHGEILTRAKGDVDRTYPSYRELARRYGVSRKRIKTFALAHDCLERRRIETNKRRERASRADAEREEDMTQTPEARSAPTPRQISLDGLMDRVGAYLELFDEALEARAVDATRALDFDRMVRLYLVLRELSQKEGEEQGGDDELTLADLQENHHALLERLRDSQKDAPYTITSHASDELDDVPDD